MKAVLLLKTLSPITHGAETAGNESIIRREAVSTPVGVRHVPVITGNSLRHRLLREPVANAIAQDWQCSKEQLRWLYNGGALAGKTDATDVKRIERARTLLPHVEAIGCSMPDAILAGKLEMGIAWLVCLETMPVIKAALSDEWYDATPIAPAHEFLSRNQYYRHDATRQRSELMDDEEKAELDYKGMPHGGEHVVPGAAFVATIHADGLSPLGCSSVVWAIEQWAKAGATVGGQASRGHGAVDPYLWTDKPVSGDLFQEHLNASLEEMRAFVSALYGKEAKAEK